LPIAGKCHFKTASLGLRTHWRFSNSEKRYPALDEPFRLVDRDENLDFLAVVGFKLKDSGSRLSE
jgi:hypothetical protein